VKITIIAVGRLKSGPEKALAAGYIERIAALGRKAGITGVTVVEIAESQAATVDLRKAEEARAITAALPPGAAVMTLDERGRSLTSEGFAAILRRHAEDARPALAFIIGGPDGLEPDFLQEHKQSLAFGEMSWPHRLVRIMLAEQIYRAVTILVNHPYHRP
jgi:23S rRNA (pseudouridine1915-N3)-methyltransferase